MKILRRIINGIRWRFQMFIKRTLFVVFRILPLQNKVISTTMRGRRYADNPRFIIEAIHELMPEMKIVWITNSQYTYDTPRWLRTIDYYKNTIRKIYELSTAKVWIDSHFIETFVKKRKGQLYIQTWHGSLPFKKIFYDTDDFETNVHSCKELSNTVRLADIFISNSKSMTNIYKSAFHYYGKVYNVGFPRNDGFVKNTSVDKEKVLSYWGCQRKKIFLYAPTFRDSFEKTGIVDYKPFNLDFQLIYNALVSTYGGDWAILVKFHPIMTNSIDDSFFKLPYVYNATKYVNMQELIMVSDILLTDYSSAMFDAAMKGVSVFTCCLDYEEYKKDRGLYFEITNLPFPCAFSCEELVGNIKSYNKEMYIEAWNKYANNVELNETGEASILIAKRIVEHVQGKTINW